MSAIGSARRGANDDHTENAIHVLREVAEYMRTSEGRRCSHASDWRLEDRVRRAVGKVRRLYPDVARVIDGANDVLHLPLGKIADRIERAHRSARVVPAGDQDLARIGHVCGPVRDDDLRQLRGASGWRPKGGAVSWSI